MDGPGMAIGCTIGVMRNAIGVDIAIDGIVRGSGCREQAQPEYERPLHAGSLTQAAQKKSPAGAAGLFRASGERFRQMLGVVSASRAPGKSGVCIDRKRVV